MSAVGHSAVADQSRCAFVSNEPLVSGQASLALEVRAADNIHDASMSVEEDAVAFAAADSEDEDDAYYSEDDDDDDTSGIVDMDENAIALQNAFNIMQEDIDDISTLLPPEVAALFNSMTESVGRRVNSSDGNKWKLYGIFPHNVYIDTTQCDSATALLIPFQRHSFAPLQGSFCAAYPTYALNGQLLSMAYPDFSHFSCPLSAIRKSRLVSLPHSYTDLYHMVRE